MRVIAINRSEEKFARERRQDLQKVHKNLDPSLHPYEKAVEYTRALNAAKLDRVFAKPFVAAFTHDDGITCLARNLHHLNGLVSGCADGNIHLWDVPARRCLRKLVGHTGPVKGLAVTPDGDAVVSCSTDCSVRLFRLPFAPFAPGPVQDAAGAVLEFQGRHAFRGVDHHWTASKFATAGAQVDVWDHERSEPVSSFAWGADTVTAVRFNPADSELLASAASDRAVALYDLRNAAPVRKLVMQTRTNAIAWNPMEPMNLTLASEDCNLYTYDMRRLQSALCVHKDFTSAVMDVDYSPTGREFVAGSYDRSLRIFGHTGGRSREVYHTARMQRVFAARFSGDGAYVFSGSDDMNVRVWKAQASAQQGTLLPREKHKQAYQAALVERFRHLPEVRRIERHRHLPAALYKATKVRRAAVDADTRKLKRRKAHSAPGSVEIKPERQKRIVAELE
ncbi:hypothetical protein WJX81_004545 [Elliptochloris bilobata]|uniref:DDB1- and CUL4-associated factor 13 n=1 Tax=Elliptochloris bilobata TaxID=381761 RepID=A0AAW1RWM0_9CHLO